jgi:predicted regulator of Ras-like GTPase activity (Roadblock/LC7/MglB family)
MQTYRLLNNDGVLLAYSGYGESNVTVTAAIAANIWTLYEKHGHDTFHGDPMQTVLIECQVGIFFFKQFKDNIIFIFRRHKLPSHAQQIYYYA